MFDKVIVIGIFISLIYSEITGFSPSGLIVPGYIALNINNPIRIISTLIVALFTYIIIKLLKNFMIIYGKRQFALSIAISIIVNYLIVNISPFNMFNVIGNIISGIISNQWQKEGILISLISLAIVVCIIIVLMMLIGFPIL